MLMDISQRLCQSDIGYHTGTEDIIAIGNTLILLALALLKRAFFPRKLNCRSESSS